MGCSRVWNVAGIGLRRGLEWGRIWDVAGFRAWQGMGSSKFGKRQDSGYSEVWDMAGMALWQGLGYCRFGIQQDLGCGRIWDGESPEIPNTLEFGVSLWDAGPVPLLPLLHPVPGSAPGSRGAPEPYPCSGREPRQIQHIFPGYSLTAVPLTGSIFQANT